MKKITAKISLTEAEWSLLSLCFINTIPMLPKSCWEVTEEIENALANAKEEK